MDNQPSPWKRLPDWWKKFVSKYCIYQMFSSKNAWKLKFIQNRSFCCFCRLHAFMDGFKRPPWDFYFEIRSHHITDCKLDGDEPHQTLLFHGFLRQNMLERSNSFINCLFFWLWASMAGFKRPLRDFRLVIRSHHVTDCEINGDEPHQTFLFRGFYPLKMRKSLNSSINCRFCCFSQFWATMTGFLGPSWDFQWIISPHHGTDCRIEERNSAQNVVLERCSPLKNDRKLIFLKKSLFLQFWPTLRIHGKF